MCGEDGTGVLEDREWGVEIERRKEKQGIAGRGREAPGGATVRLV